MAKNFKFVNLTGPAQLNDVEYKRTVRSSAMRAWRQSERLKQVAKYNSRGLAEHATTPFADDNAPSTPSTQSEPSSDDERLDRISGLIMKRSSSPGSAVPDPFMATAIALPAKYQELLWYFSTRIDVIIAPLGGCSYPNSWTHTWLKGAVSNPLILMATCCHAAAHQSDFLGQGSNILTLQLRSATLELLKKSLQSETTRASDEAMAAVSLLAANSLISGDTEELGKHMRALTQMASLRGNLQNLGFDGLLRRALSWHYAPTKILTQPQQTYKALLKIPEHDDPTATTAAYARFAALEPLIKQTRRLTNQLDTAEPRLSQTMAAQLAFIDDRSELEISLVTLYESWCAADNNNNDDDIAAVDADADALADRPSPSPSLSPGTHVARCLCAALLVYNFRHLRTFAELAPTVRRLSEDLVAGLMLFAAGGCAEGLASGLSPLHLECLFWAVVLELQVFRAPGASYEFFCLTRLFRELASLLELEDVEAVKAFMRASVVWTEAAWTSRLDLVVNQIFAP